MGLDMDFYKINSTGEKEHIHYFRKHADLHGVLRDSFLEKNPDKCTDDFNCCEFEITMDEVDKVYEFLNSDSGKHYTGFFWGRSTEEDWEETIVLFTRIKNFLNAGYKVTYIPWW